MQNFKLFKPTHVYLVPALAEMFYKRIWRTVEEQGKAKQLKMLISVSNGLRKVGIDARRTLFKTADCAKLSAEALRYARK